MRYWLLAVCVVGCAVTKIPVPTGGSRSDGTVQLSYEYGLFQVPKVDWNSAKGSSQRRIRG